MDFGRRGVLWSHNDSGSEPIVFALDTAGALLGQVDVRGADSRDWEDIAAGPCGPDGGACLWIADTGDNAGRRESVVLFRVPEPAADAGASASADAFRVRYPEGPRDAEALAIAPGGVPHVVTKGREAGIVLYRYPPPLRPGETVTLERVHAFTDTAVALPDQVTAADWSDDGAWLATRTYATLHFWRMREGRVAGPLVEGGVPLDSLREFQGEGLALREDGTVVLTSEAAPGEAASLVLLRCELG